MQLQVVGGRRGFFGKRSRDLVVFDECWIVEKGINRKIQSLPPPRQSDKSKLEIALTESGEVLVMDQGRDPEAALFSQVNSAQNAVLKARVTDLPTLVKPDWMMDLYAGSGNLTYPLMERYPQVPMLAVELSRASVARARHRAGLRFEAGDVAKVLAREKPIDGKGLMVLDPPRLGCSNAVLDQILRHHPAEIVYVSCNPTTFSRDVEKLVEGGEYRLEQVQGLDMFPQTEHVELVARLCAATFS
ncbi:MAG: class I SAM-dependent RNA methyltransferase [Calothrix sp. SM1_5_4]|nr:class I SAM-dependent RNA methyltransferase [Calothrix sp. SM1_5_4]